MVLALLRTSFLCLAFLRWYGTLEYGETESVTSQPWLHTVMQARLSANQSERDFHEKFNFLTIQDLRPLNTCQKHFEMILPHFPLDEYEI